MISPAFDQDCYKILTLYSLSAGSRFNRKTIQHNTRMNNTPLDNALTRLLSTSILKKERTYYSINFENEQAKTLIDLCSHQYKQFKHLPFDAYFLITDLLHKIATKKNIQAYLFGSYSKLVYTEKSDVDIAILKPKEFNEKDIERWADRIGKTYGKQVQIQFFDKENFLKNKKDPLVKEILTNGVRLI